MDKNKELECKFELLLDRLKSIQTTSEYLTESLNTVDDVFNKYGRADEVMRDLEGMKARAEKCIDIAYQIIGLRNLINTENHE